LGMRRRRGAQYGQKKQTEQKNRDDSRLLNTKRGPPEQQKAGRTRGEEKIPKLVNGTPCARKKGSILDCCFAEFLN